MNQETRPIRGQHETIHIEAEFCSILVSGSSNHIRVDGNSNYIDSPQSIKVLRKLPPSRWARWWVRMVGS